MNIIILAGGYAERLWPLTQEYPKTLLRIAGKPVLYHLLENLSHIASADNLIIATDESKQQFFSESENDINIVSSIRPTIVYHKVNKDRSIKGPVEKIVELLEIKHESFELRSDDFLLVGGDNVFGFDLNEFCSFYLREGTSCNAVQQSIEPIDVSQFGMPTLDSKGRLTDFIEKPSAVSYKTISTACYLLHRRDVELAKAYLAAGGRDTLGEFIRYLITQTIVVGYRFQENWYDIGTKDGILAANEFLMSWKEVNTKEPGHVYGETRVIPPVYVEASAVIKDSTIGPNVYIGSGSKIYHSVIQNSIVYDRCDVQRCNLKNSIVGSDSKVEGNISEAVFGPKTLVVTEMR